MEIDFNTIRLQFEMFGSDVKVLADEHNVDPEVIEYEKNRAGWAPKPVALATRDWESINDISEITEDLLEEVQDRANILQTIKQSALDPQYIKVESALLNKAVAILHSIDAGDHQAALQLKQVASVYKELVEMTNTHLKKVGANNAAAGSGGLKINIISKFDNHSSSEGAVGIQIEA